MPEHRLDSVVQNRPLGQVVKLESTGPTAPAMSTDEMAAKAAEISDYIDAQNKPLTKKKPVLTELEPKKTIWSGSRSENRQLKAIEGEY